MDERYGRASRPASRGPSAGQDGGAGAGRGAGERGMRAASPAVRPPPGASQPAGGLLTRYAEPGSEDANGGGAAGGAPSQRPNAPKSKRPGSSSSHGKGLLSRARDFGETVLRATVQRDRVPQAGNWRASDFSRDQLDAWDREDSAPFDVPRGEDDTPPEMRRRPRHSHRAPPRGDERAPRRAERHESRGARMLRDDEDLDTGWETGTWDTDWATGGRHSVDYRPSGADDSGFWRRSRPSEPLGTMAVLAAPRSDMSRRERIRVLRERRPAAAAILLVLVVGFVLAALAPMIPLLRLGYDSADLAYRVSSLQSMFSGGSSALFNTSKLTEAQGDVDSIQRDLYEINGAVNVVGAPISGVSASMRDYRLLMRIGYDLTAAGDEGLQVAQTLLTPVAGGALSADASTPGITMGDITRARGVIADAQARVLDAVEAYKQLDQGALPAQLQPGSKYGQLLALLPLAPNALIEMNSLLDAAPSLLGVGTPADYLVLAMDRTELRAGGGFMGNYGLLELDGGKQSQDHPLSLEDTYNLDTQYFRLNNPNINDPKKCATSGPKPPDYYWWWPYRELNSCQFNWGLRDSDLSPDFPTNARTAIGIVASAQGVPNNRPTQGVVAFTPALIADLLTVTGPIDLSDFNAHVTADNLETTIHDYQLGGKTPQGVDRKEFTHELASALLAHLKQMPKSQLKDVFSIIEQALKNKDLQIYLSDPRAELVLQQLGLSSQVSRGEGDGFFVVDTNDGGNKANLYVTEHQTDLVTLLPNGGAMHRLQIAVKYDKQGSIYNPGVTFDDYSDVQRTYLPGDATVFGYAGFDSDGWYPNSCADEVANGVPFYSIITACDEAHKVQPSTESDVAGRAMVMGPLLIVCGSTLPLGKDDYAVCERKPVAHTQTIYVEWYTPHAYTRGADGHGVYTELIEKQAGTTVYQDGQLSSLINLSVYVSTAALSSKDSSLPGDTGDAILTASTPSAREAAFSKLLQGNGVSQVFDGPLLTNTPISVPF
ncbi:MAG TPA: DUF4012 domain-containing protein [Ktedonobacterales bacterium]